MFHPGYLGFILSVIYVISIIIIHSIIFSLSQYVMPLCPRFVLRSLCSPVGPMDTSTLLWIHLPSPHSLMFCGCLRMRGTALPRPGKNTIGHNINIVEVIFFPVQVYNEKECVRLLLGWVTKTKGKQTICIGW